MPRLRNPPPAPVFASESGEAPPHPGVQFPAWAAQLFKSEPRYKVMYGGRGSGKSWAAARAIIIICAERMTRVLCTREVQRSIKDSVHRLLCDQIAAMGMGAGFSITDTEIRHIHTGSLIVFSGLATHTVESIKSVEGVDICWVEESQTVSARSWDILTPTIRKAGSQIWLTMNPDMDTDETYVRFIEHPPEDAWLHYANWDKNQWFSAELEKERQATLRRDPEGYANIWEGEPKRVAAGAIYRHEMQRLYEEHRVRPVPYDPILKVHTVWDLGYADSMAIGLFQRQGGEIRCIDYIEDSYRTLDWYVAEIERRRYRWGTDFIPHDGRARDFKSGKSTEEHLAAMHRNPHVLPQLSVEEGIKATRLVFPRIWFDEAKCKPLLEHLKRYQRSVAVMTNEPGQPLHDKHSHGADMLRYAAMAAELMGNVDRAEPIRYTHRYAA